MSEYDLLHDRVHVDLPGARAVKLAKRPDPKEGHDPGDEHEDPVLVMTEDEPIFTTKTNESPRE